MVSFIPHIRSKPTIHEDDNDDSESSDEDLSDENVVKAYRLLYLKWK